MPLNFGKKQLNQFRSLFISVTGMRFSLVAFLSASNSLFTKNLVGLTHLAINIREPIIDCSSLLVRCFCYRRSYTYPEFLEVFLSGTDRVLVMVFTMTPKQLPVVLGGSNLDVLIGKPNF